MNGQLGFQKYPIQSLFGVLILATVWSSPAYALKKCNQLLKQKKYEQAGICFSKKSKEMPPLLKLSAFKKRLKGRYINKAARCFQKAADQSNLPQQQRYLLEKSIKLLKEYFDYCSSGYRCDKARKKYATLRKKIGYSRIVLNTGTAEALQLLINGYKVRKKLQIYKKWYGVFRPGNYQFKLTNQKGHSTSCPVTLKPNVKHKVTCKIPIPKETGSGASGIGMAGLITGIVGVAAAATGGVLLGLGYSATGSYEAHLEKAKNASEKERIELAKSKPPKQAFEEFQAGSAKIMPGWALVGIGAGAAIVGFVLWGLNRGGGKTKTAKLPQHPDSLPQQAWFQFTISN